MRILQSEKYVSEDWWRWAVWLDGTNAELDGVECVEWRLHPTFREPVRKVASRSTNFRLETEGWGVFPIHAVVSLKDGSVVKLKHHLALTRPDGDKNSD